MEFLKNIKRAWHYTKGHRGNVIKYIICSIIMMINSIIVPILGAKLIVYLTNNMLLQLIYITLIFFALESLQDVLHFAIQRYSQIIFKEFFVKLQIELGKNVLKLDNSTLEANGSGVFIERMNSDTRTLADVFGTIMSSAINIITNLGIFIALFIINKVMFVCVLISVVVMYIIKSIQAKRHNILSKEYRKKHEKVTGFIGEMVRGSRDIKMLNAENSFVNTLSDKLKSDIQSRYHMLYVDNVYSLIFNLIYDFFNLLFTTLMTAYLVYIGQLSITDALVVYNYSGRVSNIVYYLGMIIDYIKEFNLASERIYAIIDGNGFGHESFGERHLEKVNGDFEFKNVCFSYDKEKILRGVSFKIFANETVAFVGKSGAGKTTIFNLLCKMYNPTKGKITIDGVDIEKLDKDSIRGNITIINQDPYIFNLTIRENLRLVKEDVSDEEMIEACRMACLDEFIESLPDKYDTIVGEGGVNLSGGQKQRLAIARALVQKTEIILFDEATSALDNETQAHIQKAIENMREEYTILIIAHRLSTIVNADRILFLNDGKIECEGTHGELLKKSQAYKNLYESEIRK